MAEQDQKQPENEVQDEPGQRTLKLMETAEEVRSEAADAVRKAMRVSWRRAEQLQEDLLAPGMPHCAPRPMPRMLSAALSRTWRKPASLRWSALPGLAAGGR